MTTPSIFSISLDTTVFGFSRVLTRLRQQVETALVDDALRQAVQRRLDHRVDIVVVDRASMLSHYLRAGKDRGRLTALGLYLADQELSPNVTRSQIFLCPYHCIDAAESLGEQSEAIYGQTFVHEFGHHVFRLSDCYLERRQLTLISEGLANFFVWLLMDPQERSILDVLANAQPIEYRFYTVITSWLSSDQDVCIRELAALANGEELRFLVEFLKFCLANPGVVVDFDDTFIEQLAGGLMKDDYYEATVDMLAADPENILLVLNNVNNTVPKLNELTFRIMKKIFFVDNCLQMEVMSSYSWRVGLLREFIHWMQHDLGLDISSQSEMDLYIKALESAQSGDVKTAVELTNQLLSVKSF